MAGRIPQHFIDELIARTDIVDVIDSRVPLKKRGKEHIACCPFHNEKTPSFTVSQDKQFYHCFGCGAHGTAIGFLMEYESLDFVEAVETLAQQLGLEVPREGAAQTRPRFDTDGELERLMEQAAAFFKAQLRQSPEAIAYLKGRGLDGVIAAEFGLGYAPDRWDSLLKHLGGTDQGEALARAGLVIERDTGGYYDRFRNRIMFPIRNRRGRVIAFGGRILGSGEPKYLNSPETPLFHKGRELYGLFEARKSGGRIEQLVLVEGYMDVIALAQAGIRNAVATLGTATTSEHLLRLFRTAPEVVFCFDGDRAGRQAAWKALETALPVLRDGLEARFLFLPEGEDPDSMVRRVGAEGFRAHLGQATSIGEFLIEQLKSRFNIETQAGRARLGEYAIGLLSDLADGLLRDQLMENLARVTDLSSDKLRLRLRDPKRPAVESSPAPRRIDEHHVRRNSVRLAISLLLNRPALASELDAVDWLRALEQPGAELLADILETLRENPNLAPAAVIERWRGREQERHLASLLEWQPPEDEQVLRSEFRDAMRQLRLKHDDQRTENLLRKARSEGLEPTEKVELQNLLRSRGPTPS